MAEQHFDNSDIEFDQEDSEEDSRPTSVNHGPTKITVKQAEGQDLSRLLIGQHLTSGRFKRIKNDVYEPNFGA